MDEVLEAGGEIGKRNVEQSIMQHGHFRTGTLLRSINFNPRSPRGGATDGIQICSECGEEHEWEDYRAPYCDTCGAKMNKEDVWK